ncbi:MAG TPA: alpha/beta hydrolase [Candidatus Thermoplasmatota archaeon]|nr:alpha/beta hydrolase [Candidatus Thermoplasmatota archaeon]
MRLVAIHGLGCAASQGWPRVAAALAPEHELVALPLVGADGPTLAPPDAWGVLAQSERLVAHVRPTDVLVGHSMGGTIATRVAQRVAPRALVLIEPHVIPRAGFVVRPTLDLRPAPSPDVLAAYLRRFESIDTGEGGYDKWIARWDWRVFRRMSEELAAGDRGTPSWTEALASFHFPVHVVWGGASDDPGEDHHAEALRKIGFPFHVVQGSKHFIPSEAPEGLAQTLRDIVARLTKP